MTGQEVGVDPNAPALEEADVDESEDVDESKADPAAEPQGSSAENGDTTPSDTAKPAMPEMAGDDGADLEDGEDDDDRDDDAEEPIEAKVEPVAPEDELGDLLERQRELVDRQMALLEDAAEEAVDEIEAEPDSGPEEVAVEPVESEKTSNGLAIPVSSTTLVLGAVGLAGVMIWLGRRRIQGQGQVAEDDQEDVVGGTVGQPLVDDTARLVDDLPEELKDEFDDWA